MLISKNERLINAIKKLQPENNFTGIDITKMQVILLRHREREMRRSNIAANTFEGCERWELGISTPKLNARVMLYRWDNGVSVLDWGWFRDTPDDGRIEKKGGRR